MEKSKVQMSIRQTFKQAELSLGLSKQFYDAKFVYQQQQTSNPQAYLLSVFKELPSQLHGFTQESIQLIHAFAAQIMEESAKSLQVPICTLILAKTIFHFFYARKSFLQYDFRDIMMGAMYLACKSQETPFSSYQIAMVFDYVLKAYQGDKSLSPLDTSSIEYDYIKKQTIPKVQLDILFQLGFQIYRLFNLPHRYVATLLSLFDKHPKYSLICQQAWKNLNDCYQSTVCLYYTPQIIGAAAVYMSMRQCNANFPEIPWWTLMQAYQEALQNVEIVVKNLQRLKSKIKMKEIALRINQAGESQGIENAFPVPYYRKIMLQRKEKLKVKIQHPYTSNNNLQNKTIFKRQTKTDFINKNHHISPTQKSDDIQVKKQKNNSVTLNTQQEVQQKKSNANINKKNLIANINQSLQKHEAAIHAAKNKTIQKSSSSSSPSSEDEQIIAQLRTKVLKNKQEHKNEQNK